MLKITACFSWIRSLFTINLGKTFVVKNVRVSNISFVQIKTTKHYHSELPKVTNNSKEEKNEVKANPHAPLPHTRFGNSELSKSCQR